MIVGKKGSLILHLSTGAPKVVGGKIFRGAPLTVVRMVLKKTSDSPKNATT